MGLSWSELTWSCSNTSDDRSVPIEPKKKTKAKQGPLVPSLEQLQAAMEDLEKLLRLPRCNTQQSYKNPGFDKKTTKQLEAIKVLCLNAIELESKKAPGDQTKVWAQAAVLTVRTLGYSNEGSNQPGEKKSKDL